MNTSIWLYWFPIVLVVSVAAGLLGRSRGVPLGLAGALYWLALGLTGDHSQPLADPRHMAGLILGAAAIAAIGLWMADPRSRAPRQAGRATANRPAGDPSDDITLSLGDAVVQFDDWLAANRHRADPWPDFGEFVRSVLSLLCGARHIRAYRLAETDDSQLYPLRRTDPEERDFPSARAGIIGHVVTSGKSYYAGDPTQGELVERLAADSAMPGGCAWCFPIKQGRRAMGVVLVGETNVAPTAGSGRLRLVEGVVVLCWIALTEACRSRLAGSTDPVSGVLTQDAFAAAAGRSLRSSYEQGEPVALINIGIEGLRTLADNGQWDLANQVLYEVSSVLKQRIRQDDEIGVFDGSRFLLLLRRVDSELAKLIVKQLMDKLAEICNDTERWGVALPVRCGVAGSGLSRPGLRALISRSTARCQEARKQGITIASDLSDAEEACRT